MTSSILNDKDKFVEYKYIVSEFYIITNGKSESLPLERVQSFRIEHYFELATFPIFRMSVLMEPSRYYNIIKNKGNVKFKVRVQSYYMENDTEKRSMVRDVLNDVFILFPEDSGEDYEIDLKKEAKTDKDLNELESIDNLVELFFFKDSIVTGLRSTVNLICEGANLSTIVAYLLQRASVKNVLMSPFENNQSYGSLILPPQTIEKQLKYLNNNYGFHRNGTLIYFGIFHSYILNYKSGCTAWYPNEWKETVIYVLEKSNTRSFVSNTIQKYNEKRYYFSAASEGVSISNNSVSENVMGGTNVTAIDMKGNSSASATSNAKVIENANTAVIFNNTSNPFMATAYAAQQKANSVEIRISMENVNIDAFNPNKAFSIVFENATLNAKYKGNYNIASAIYDFRGTTGNYGVTALLTFKKVD